MHRFFKIVTATSELPCGIANDASSADADQQRSISIAVSLGKKTYNSAIALDFISSGNVAAAFAVAASEHEAKLAVEDEFSLGSIIIVKNCHNSESASVSHGSESSV